MKVLRCQKYFVRSYQESLMSQIIQDMAVVLPIWMLMMTTKIFVLTNLGKNPKCCHGKSAFATSQNDDIVSEFFEIGESLFLTNYGWSGLVKVKYFSLDESNILKIVVKNTNRENIVTTKEHLCSAFNPDIIWITESAP